MWGVWRPASRLVLSRLLLLTHSLILYSLQPRYVAANRMHDAQYHEACKLVYVHNKAFGFKEEK